MKILLLFIHLFFLASCGVQQRLSASYKLTEGMTKDEVEGIIGKPVKTELNQKVEEWHYCSTGGDTDKFLAVFFFEGQLIAKTIYSVTLQDTGGEYGLCKKFIKMGNYKEPDVVSQLRYPKVI